MMINWEDFTPWMSLSGGILIGLAVSVLILMNGKIAGISGIVAGLVKTKNINDFWRIAFVFGLLISPYIYRLFAPLPDMAFKTNFLTYMIAGLLVGFGTRLGSGCTSGHGVCGLARLSLRSLVAVITFMITAMLTTFLVSWF